jgi:hypothetical protein
MPPGRLTGGRQAPFFSPGSYAGVETDFILL